MTYADFETEDLVLNLSFQNYCLGKHQDDVTFWQNWIAKHPDKAETIQLARKIYLSLNGNLSAEQFAADRDEFIRIAEKHILETTNYHTTLSFKPVNRSPLRRLVLYGSVAAAVFIGVVFLTKFSSFTNTNPVSKYLTTNDITKVSKQGERKSFQLPDGSIVMLNAESVIHIDENFNTKNRELTLEGEAYFDVAHDASRPFVIHTNNMDIKVLGTTFNVKAYPGDKIAETSLIKGSVEISLRNQKEEKIQLHPNEKIIIPNTAGNTETITTNNTDNKTGVSKSTPDADYKIIRLTYDKKNDAITEVLWTKNRLAFNNCSFENIAKDLERWYNVKISFTSEEVKTYRFTATFDQKNIERVLEAFQLSRYFEFTIANNRIIIGQIKSN